MFVIREVSYIAAFMAGLLSFLSPCILPLVPGYISFISGMSLENLNGKEGRKRDLNYRIVTSALFFIFGFSLVFILLGASATLIGQFLQKNLVWFRRIGGLVVILFGLHMIGIINISFLNYQKKFQYSQNLSYHFVFTPLFIGFAFAFGWTPCIGPILAAILVYAGTQETILKGVTLLLIYSAGLGVPFLLTAFMVSQFYLLTGKVKKYFHTIEWIGGILLILIGFLIFNDYLSFFTL